MRYLLLMLLGVLGMATIGTAVPQTVVINGNTYYLGYIPKKAKNPIRLETTFTDLPLSYDAVAAGKATPVKDDGQGSCGDCWAWARTSSLEAAAISAGLYTNALKLSEEDTTVNASDEDGCDGGSMDFNYEMAHGVTLQANCPFTEGRTSCDAAPVAKGVSMAYIGDSNGPTDAQLMAAIYQYGSVAVTVAAGGNFDVDDGSDRMTSCDSFGIDHMVSLVGYRPSPDGGVEYKMKNSWGQGWGAQGYAYLKKGCNQIATGDESAMVISVSTIPPGPPPPPPPASSWECEARPARGTPIYTGQGSTEQDAKQAAISACRGDGHLICYSDGCSQVTNELL